MSTVGFLLYINRKGAFCNVDDELYALVRTLSPPSESCVLPDGGRKTLPLSLARTKKGSKSASAAMAVICRLGTAVTRSLARRMIAAPPHRRSFSAVALADYWTEWEEEEEDKERFRHAMTAAEACGEREPGGVQWVFMGSPAAQRHVYATRVAKLLDVPYISMGSLVRQELNPSSCLYNQVSLSSIILAISPQSIFFSSSWIDLSVMLFILDSFSLIFGANLRNSWSFCSICGVILVIYGGYFLFLASEMILAWRQICASPSLLGVVSSFSGNCCQCSAIGFLELSVTSTWSGGVKSPLSISVRCFVK